MNKLILLTLTLTTTITHPMTIRQALRSTVQATSLLAKHPTQGVLHNQLSSYSERSKPCDSTVALADRLIDLQKQFIDLQQEPGLSLGKGIGSGILAAPLLYYSINHGFEFWSVVSFLVGSGFTSSSIRNTVNGASRLSQKKINTLLHLNLEEQRAVREKIFNPAKRSSVE